MLLIAFIKKLCPGLTTLQQTGRMLKILSFCLLAAVMQLSARSTAAQGLSLSFSNAGLPAIFNAIQQQTPYRFVYTNEQVAGAVPVTINVQNASLEKVLELCFKDQPLAFSLEDKFIIVRTKEKKTIAALPAENEVRGRVSNENNEALAGASVSVKGSSRGVSTDGKGGFELSDVAPGAVIVISSIGYETREIIIGNNRNLDIRLRTAVNTLDETVIKGYYNTSKRLNTGSVSKVGAEVISQQPVSNVLGALEGRMPGVFIAQNTGVAGGAFSVQIRGRNSLTAGNNPLYVIDGVPFTSTPLGSSRSVSILNGSPLAAINPSDIESIEVLKDADATAIYGSRGANGVVLITTKTGKAGRTKLSVNLSAGAGKAASRMDLLDSRQYIAMRKQAFANDGVLPNATTGRDFLVWDSTRYTDWQKLLIGGTAHIADAQVSMAGGNATTQFLAAGSYRRETTVFPGDFADKKAAFHAGLTHSSAGQRFKSSINLSYINDDNTICRADPTFNALNTAPTAPVVYDSLGKLNWANSFFNPFGPLKEQYKLNTDNLVGNLVVSYELLPGLTAKASLGYTKITARENSLTPLSSLSPSLGLPSGFAYFGNSSASTWIAEPQLQYQRKMGAGKLNLLAGASFQEDIKQASLLMATGFLDDALLNNIGAAGEVNKVSDDPNNNYYRQYRYNAVFARVNYNYKDRYLVNLTGRRDGSSRFGPGKQFANFGAVGLGWIFSQEKFIRDKFPLLSYGKLRGSYGSTGNDQIPDYGYLSTYSPSSYTYDGNPGLYPTRLYNPDFAWEVNKKMEAAIELGFVKDRILLTLDYYRNRSSNQLVGFPLPGLTGFTNIQGNLPATVQNSGWEFLLSTVNIRKEGFSWTSAINLTLPRNKLVSFPGIANSNYNYVYAVGQSLGTVFKYHLTGVDKASGVYSFADINKDGTISYPDDAQFLKKIEQQWYAGIQNSFSFKGFRLDFLLQWVRQTGYNYRQGFRMPGQSNSNQPHYVLEGNQQKFSRTVGGAVYNAYAANQSLGDGNIGDASYARLKNLELSYTVPYESLRTLHMDKLVVYLQAQNLFTLTHYQGLDPETMSSTVLPPLKIIAAGIRINL